MPWTYCVVGGAAVAEKRPSTVLAVGRCAHTLCHPCVKRVFQIQDMHRAPTARAETQQVPPRRRQGRAQGGNTFLHERPPLLHNRERYSIVYRLLTSAAARSVPERPQRGVPRAPYSGELSAHAGRCCLDWNSTCDATCAPKCPAQVDWKGRARGARRQRTVLQSSSHSADETLQRQQVKLAAGSSTRVLLGSHQAPLTPRSTVSCYHAGVVVGWHTLQAAMPVVARSGAARGTMAIIGWNGDWRCSCGSTNKLWDTCTCGQPSPCRRVRLGPGWMGQRLQG